MKRILVFLIATMGLVSVYAEEYAYLTFESKDGTKVSVSTISLSITVSDKTLTAGAQSFALADLSKMYFSTTDETNEANCIKNLDIDSLDEDVEIYDLKGNKTTKDQIQKGYAYLVRGENRTYKIVVK